MTVSVQASQTAVGHVAEAGNDWSTHSIEGWQVNVAQRLEHNEPLQVTKAIGLLTFQLQKTAATRSNPQECFAESTEAFFGKYDFQPYDREALTAFDSAVVQLLKSLRKCSE